MAAKKTGRNKDKCAAYKSEGRREKNRDKRMDKLVKKLCKNGKKYEIQEKNGKFNIVRVA